ncbi:phosphatase PAP2 family protein [Pseudoxanthomonas fibrivorans]|uniref:phosphatase PAP2 family protein n=1 Tax=Pseudoxanthomonas sp. 10H TaxID=3242729 RepID=UPI003556A3F6
MSAWLVHGGDRWLADAFFHLEGDRWALRDHWATAGLIHRGGKWASVLAGVAVLGLYLRSLRGRGRQALRRPLLYLLLATALGSTTVSVLKSVTHVDCPWDLARYGGHRAQAAPFAPPPAGVPPGRCYPAGHASAGYAWVALYFAARMWRPRLRWRGLGLGIGAGVLFGLGQQLRGAHFLSHDIAALAVCWLVSLGLFGLFAARKPARSAGARRA